MSLSGFPESPRGGLSVNTVGEVGSRGLPVSRPGTPCPQVQSAADAAPAHNHSILVGSSRRRSAAGGNAAGGAVAIVVAEYIGGGTARDEGAVASASWQGRVTRENFVGNYLSRHSSHVFIQMRVNAGNTATAQYEGKSMYEDKPTRNKMRGGQYQGRVVGTAPVSGGSVSSVARAFARPVGEPALGVMGGLLQSVSSPAEPPVSSLTGPFVGSSPTAPAPYADLPAEDVSPLPNAVRAAVEVLPARPPVVSILPRGRAGSPATRCPPAPARKP
jgi:hypothetical protein